MRQLHLDPQQHLPQMRHLRRDVGMFVKPQRFRVEFDPALAIKFTICRRMPNGSPGNAEIFGSQQYGPLLDIEVPGA
jgi:hypothetical protein